MSCSSRREVSEINFLVGVCVCGQADLCINLCMSSLQNGPGTMCSEIDHSIAIMGSLLHLIFI